VQRLSGDALLLFILLVARVRIDTLAEWAAIPSAMLQRDVARLVGDWLPAPGLTLLADRQTTDPITLLLISLAFGGGLLYLVVDTLREHMTDRTVHRLKLTLLVLIIGLLVFGQTSLFIGLRHITGPAAYTHDGGVIQTEATIEYLLAGVNPYVADYTDTPMAEWGTDYRTALYHYPYLPWTFLFSAPFYLLSRLALGWFDQRMVYLLLFAVTLGLGYRLARPGPGRLGIVMVIGLNPILASDVIFGQNDSFVLFWIILGIWLLQLAEQRGNDSASTAWGLVAIGFACASKPTAWFLLPFLVLYLLPGRSDPPQEGGGRASVWRYLGRLLRRGWPLAATVVLVVGPWFVWNPGAMVDDVWAWSAGTAAVPYQIRGWGLSNLILALGLVPDRLAYWPFWITELLVAAPLLALGLWRQSRANTLGVLLGGYALLLLGFLYASRFLNENYLGFLVAVVAVAHFCADADQHPAVSIGQPDADVL
jgi:hypothetical protein